MSKQYILCEDCDILWNIDSYLSCPVCQKKQIEAHQREQMERLYGEKER